MKKTAKNFIILLVLTIITIGVYWFAIHPNSYKYNTAINNGDVVMGAGGVSNLEKFDTFIINVETKQVDKIRITAFSKEGYPIIFDLDFDGKIINCTTDNTRNIFGRRNFKEYGKYSKIIKNEINDYFLVDETGNYEDRWIFQE